jgi:hypothetical protein
LASELRERLAHARAGPGAADEEHDAVVGDAPADCVVGAASEVDASALESVSPEDLADGVGLVPSADEKSHERVFGKPFNAEVLQSLERVRRQPLCGRAWVDHGSRGIPHSVDKSRLLEVFSDASGFGRDGPRVTSARAEQGETFEHASEAAELLALEQEGLQRPRHVERELRVGWLSVKTGKPMPAFHEVPAGRALRGKGPGHQDGVHGVFSANRNEEIGETRVSPQHDPMRPEHLFEAALVVRVSVSLPPVRELEVQDWMQMALN